VDYLTVGTVSKIDGRYEIDARTVSIDRMIIVHAMEQQVLQFRSQLGILNGI
jgi:hypothetical protein